MTCVHGKPGVPHRMMWRRRQRMPCGQSHPSRESPLQLPFPADGRSISDIASPQRGCLTRVTVPSASACDLCLQSWTDDVCECLPHHRACTIICPIDICKVAMLVSQVQQLKDKSIVCDEVCQGDREFAIPPRPVSGMHQPQSAARDSGREWLQR